MKIRLIHGNLEKVKNLLAQHPQLVDAANEWSPSDRETAIQAAAHAGSAAVAEYLLARGATGTLGLTIP